MAKTFYFYDLETSGLDSRNDRIMQFAGMRTDKDFNVIGEPDNILVQLSEDTLPSPDAIMVTGITPSSTRLDGINERDFCQFFMENVATTGTTILGYNSVRFDDGFIRAALWRNFYDPYEWQWKQGRSRWDMLDVVRLTRALRPEGIEWPFTPEGKPTNRLELITKANHITHEHAHDALSDVEALISVTKLIHKHQPQLFDFLYNLREKNAIKALVNLSSPAPFVYASGRYSSEFQHTTVAYPIAGAPSGSILVFDLRYNLDELLAAEEEAKKAGTVDMNKPYYERELWERNYFPVVKRLQYNHCPAVAPLGVLEKENGWQKIGLSLEQIQQNLASLKRHPEFIKRMSKVPQVDPGEAYDAESRLYEKFLSGSDRRLCSVIRCNGQAELTAFHPQFDDARLEELLLHYKAKYFPLSLDPDEQPKWEEYCRARLARQTPRFKEGMERIEKSLAAGQPIGSRTLEECKFLAEDLMLWYQSVA